MRKGIITILSLLLICIHTIGVSASTKDIINISIDNIEDIMIEYSPDIKIINNNLKAAEENYDDLVDDIKDLEEKRDKLKKDYEQAVKDEENQIENVNTDNSDLIKKALREIDDNINILKETKDKTKSNLKIFRIQYDENVKKLVLSVQQEYVSYLDILSKKELKKDEVNSSKRKTDTNKMKYEEGFISKKEYTSNLIENTFISNSFEELSKKEEISIKNLYLSLGLGLNVEINFNNDINIDLEKISKLKYQNDLDTMFDNNSSIRIKEIELNEAEDVDDNDYLTENAEISLKQEKNIANLEFEKQYNMLMNSYNTIKNSKDRLDENQNNFNIMQEKYNYGFVSKNEIDDLECNLNIKKSDFTSERNNLYVNYLRYLQMREGY